MRKTPFILALLYSFFILNGSVFGLSESAGLGERTITLGSGSWELIEKWQGVIEAARIRPDPVLVLSTGTADDESTLDLHLTFDEGSPHRFVDSQRRYNAGASPDLAAASAPFSRIGSGAALFSGSGREPLVLTPRGNALFAEENHIRDFTIEFWLYPQNMENGEFILSFASSKANGRGAYINQRIQCYVSRNRLTWSFENFFFAPGESNSINITLTGAPVLNRNWSHHLIRFDADTGLLEYMADGRTEAVEYATSLGREGGEVYTPVTGENCRIILGSRFSGMMDEFRIHNIFLENSSLAKYPDRGGRVESRTLDLGYQDSRILKIDAFGGRTGIAMTSVNQTAMQNEYTGNSSYRFQDHSEMNFFIRTSNSPYRWNDIPWIPVKPGTELPDTFRGRFVQIAVDFYPGADGEFSPYLSELNIVYKASEPPQPPTLLTASAKDGAVELSWRASPSMDLGGYLVYYGTAGGEYFGAHARIGDMIRSSPIDVGNRTSVRIEGLNNGTLYYFAVAAYNRLTGDFEPGRVIIEPGEFSREAAARPLRTAE